MQSLSGRPRTDADLNPERLYHFTAQVAGKYGIIGKDDLNRVMIS